MNLFLLLTAMLCGLTGVTRPVGMRSPAVEESCVVVAAYVACDAVAAVVAPRPDGYVPPSLLSIDLSMALSVAALPTPERRRE